MSKRSANAAQDDENKSGFFAWLGEPEAAPPWSMGETIAALVAYALALTMLASGVALSGVASINAPIPAEALLSSINAPIPAEALLFGWTVGLLVAAAFVFFTRQRRPQQRAALALHSASLLPLPIVLLLGLAAAFTIDLIAAAGVGSILPLAPLRGLGSDAGTWLLAAVFLLLAQPLGEGLVFQGLLLPRLRASLGPWGGWLLTGLLYALLSFLIYGAQISGADQIWYGLIAPLLSGLFLGALRVRSGSTRAAIVGQMGLGLGALALAFALLG